MIVIEDDAYAFISLEGDTRFGDPLQTLVPERTIYIGFRVKTYLLRAPYSISGFPRPV